MRRAALAATLACALAIAVDHSTAFAQTTTLAITSGSTTTFAQPALTDYVNGYIDGPTINFTVSLNGGPPSQPTHTVTVEICATTVDLGNGKALSKLLWEPSDLSLPFQQITQGCGGAVQATRTVVTRTMAKNSSFSLGVKLRMMLDWTDTASSYGTTIAMTVNVSTP